MQLYPLKFTPCLLPKIWGGQHIKEWYLPTAGTLENVGESWLISSMAEHSTVVANGFLAGNELRDLLEVYMGDLVGDKVYEVFGNMFPVLLKFIDADEDLSIQVHPDDDYAFENEESLGKVEMWYVMPSEPDAAIVWGWKQSMTKQQVHDAIAEGCLSDYLAVYPVHEGDAVMIPSGTVHAMKRGTIVAEVQEASDITYRLYDYDRLDANGSKRILHLQKALDVMDYKRHKESVLHPQYIQNGVNNLAQTPYFTTNIISFDRTIERDYAPLDSFVAYMCVQGAMELCASDADEENRIASIQCGEAVLLPAVLNDIVLTPITQTCRILEIYIDTNLLVV